MFTNGTRKRAHRQMNHPSMVAATSAPPEQHKQVQKLKQQVKELTTQVATLVKQCASPMTQQS